MPKQTRYAPRGGEPEPARRRPASSGMPVGPLLGMLVLIGVAIAAARMYAEGPRAEEASSQGTPAHVPFASVPDEQPPPPRGGGGRVAASDIAPPGLETRAVWQQALAIAARADEALEKSRNARQQSDSTAIQRYSREARDLYDEALTLTAEFEDELLSSYGDVDRQVRRIQRTRDSWFRNLTALHKTTGR